MDIRDLLKQREHAVTQVSQLREQASLLETMVRNTTKALECQAKIVAHAQIRLDEVEAAIKEYKPKAQL